MTAFEVNGQLGNAKATLYAPTVVTTIKSITLVNTDAVARTVNLYIKTGTSRRIIPKTLSLSAGASLVDDTVHVLVSGDVLEGDASTAAVVDWVVSGFHA